MEAKDDFPKSDFRVLRTLVEDHWVATMVSFILKELKDLLLQCSLYHTVRAVQFGIALSHYHFFCNAREVQSGLLHFLHPVREMWFALHEMYEVSRLPIGELPQEEYILGMEELHLIKKDAP